MAASNGTAPGAQESRSSESLPTGNEDLSQPSQLSALTPHNTNTTLLVAAKVSHGPMPPANLTATEPTTAPLRDPTINHGANLNVSQSS